MAAPVLPFIVVAGLIGGLFYAASKKRAARTPVEPEEKFPVQPPGQPTPAQIVTYGQPGSTQTKQEAANILFSHVMRDDFTDTGQLEVAAAQLETWGYHDLAAIVMGKAGNLLGVDQVAQDVAQTRARTNWETALGHTPSQAELISLYDGAMAINDPALAAQIQYAEAALRAYGLDERADTLHNHYLEVSGGLPTPPVLPPPGTTTATTTPTIQPGPPAPTSVITTTPPPATPAQVEDIDVTPVANAEEDVSVDPIGTVRLAKALIAVESERNWKTAMQPEVTEWQRKAGLSADGKFGPNSAVRMADEVSMLPRIRYWSGWDKSTELKKYRDRINAKADEELRQGDSAHASGLRLSAIRETGQGWPNTPAPVPSTDRDAEIALVYAIADGVDDDELDAMIAAASEGGEYGVGTRTTA